MIDIYNIYFFYYSIDNFFFDLEKISRMIKRSYSERDGSFYEGN